MQKIRRELRRCYHQLHNSLRHGAVASVSRTRRTNKPAVLLDRPELEIDSPLEPLALSVALRVDDFFFVHIGAFDGQYQDPLPAMARRHGWRGVLVEPQPGAFENLRRRLACDADRLAFENAAVGPNCGELTLHTTRSEPSHLASVDRGNLLRRGVNPAEIIATRVPCLTIQALLAKHHRSHAHLIQIDAEGYDDSIIRSIDFDRMKPEIIRYEHIHQFEPQRSELLELLASHGYRFLLEDSDTIAWFDSFAG